MIAYQTKGKGTPIVLIHAFPLSSQMWDRQIEEFSEFGQVIAPDLPGFGRSVLHSEVSIADMAKEIAELLESLRITEPAFIGGLSLGGYVAFELMRQFPEKVRALGLFSTRPTADTSEARQKRMQAIEMIEKEGIPAFAQKTVHSLLGKSATEDKPDLVKLVESMILKNPEGGIVNALRAMADRRDSTDLVKKIDVPVLILAGSEDEVIPPSASETMHAQISDSVLEIIHCSGHLVSLEQPSAFRLALIRFLEERILAVK